MHSISWAQAAAKKTMSEILNLLGDAAQQFMSKNTPVLRQFYNPNFPFTFSEYAGEISPSLRNGIYVILIGSTALTMCCFGLYTVFILNHYWTVAKHVAATNGGNIAYLLRKT